ncbi:MAG TPA: TIGR02757 family protein [Ignavibacteria bacterium]|nr:TIGR02757 family protein [Ignavibacteria bacterium]
MDLKQKLDYHYNAFDKTKISPDPLQFLHLFSHEKDIEIMGFIASIFSYGNVKQIINTLNKFLQFSENQPYNFIINADKKLFKSKLNDLKHRFYTTDDLAILFLIIGNTLQKYKSLKEVYLSFYKPEDFNIKNSLVHFSDYFIKESEKMCNNKITPGLRFMFPLPNKGGACKRMNLFLRWMVRKDELDFGLWNEIPAHKLIIPVDTHVARISRSLGLTKIKNVGWKMAEDITANLKKIDPCDPVKYDFAICHIGMRKMIF